MPPPAKRTPAKRTPAKRTPAKRSPASSASTNRRPVVGALLTPGASAGRDQAALVAIDEALTAAGIGVERMDFPYRLAGRRAPDRPPVLVAAVQVGTSALAARLGAPGEQIALGGRSMGGRMCSMAVAEGLPAAALILVSYPLHPPGRPDRMRTEHFGAITVPCLFLSGTRDAFGTPDELVQATKAIPGPVTHQWVEGGDHGLRGQDGAVAGIVRDWVVDLGG